VWIEHYVLNDDAEPERCSSFSFPIKKPAFVNRKSAEAGKY
jgi:hypothetical protein